LLCLTWNKNFVMYILLQTGHTDDYSMMLQNLVEKHPNTKIVCVGYSLGGNLVTKYLGERGPNKLSNIIGGISICQGYNALE
jgi:abhydrolase domain-containing protein 2